jgi:nicotinate-nucleotide--dimethylbenzimidazole phosphoribosyltransferase
MELHDAIAAHLDGLAKPQGSLGKLERLATHLCLAQRTLAPVTTPRTLLVFAGDHGVVSDGVGIWPSEVTAAMLGVVENGRACCSALAVASHTSLRLIDVGSKIPAAPGKSVYTDRRVARGTASLAHGPSMTPEQFWAAWTVGQHELDLAKTNGARVVAVGEVGIGNTTAASCLIALGCEVDAESVVGPGAGSTPESLARKTAVVSAAVNRARGLLASDPVAAMASVAGFEIVAMAGAISAAAQAGVPVVLDGVVTGAAAIIAQSVDPAALDSAIASHTSAEPAHAIALRRLELEPYLDWQMRLGEGTGALLLMPMLDAAAALMTKVATLKEVTG